MVDNNSDKSKADAAAAAAEAAAEADADKADAAQRKKLGQDPSFLVRINALFDAMLKSSPILKNRIRRKQLQLWFDLPEKKADQPSTMTLCIYLHSLSENTSMRSGDASHWGQTRNTAAQPDASIMVLPGYVNITCNYLIILWDPAKSPVDIVKTQNAIYTSEIIQTLVNTQYDDNIPEKYEAEFPWFSGHFIQNSERMESLGSFWQSLDMRPRLCLHYEVTVPVEIKHPDTPLAIFKESDIHLSVDMAKAKQEADARQAELKKTP